MSAARHRRQLIVAAAVAVVALAAISTIAIAAAAGAFESGHDVFAGCSTPSLPGSIVEVRLMNMGGPMMDGRSPSMGGMGGTMRIAADRSTVPAGTVSFRVANVGTLVHELVVLPLAEGVAAGQRAVGSDGRVDEAGSLGEASQTCGDGEGDGIAPGAAGWVTLELPPGRYELVCNLAGHYAAGMRTGLSVR